MKFLHVLVLLFYCGVTFASPSPMIKSIELADLLKQLMLSDKPTDNKDSFLKMKDIFGQLKQAESNDLTSGYESFPANGNDFLYIYHGRVTLLAGGRPIATDRMENDNSWKVWLAGPRTDVVGLWLSTENSSAGKAGPLYLKSKGIILDAIACDYMSGGNYTAWYKASVPSKKPMLLEITASSGSGGTWYTYHVTWFSITASKLPKNSQIGLCEIRE